MLTYGVVVWWRTANHHKILFMLSQITRLNVMLWGGIRRSTPTVALEVMSYLPPLDLYLQGEVTKTWRRIRPIREEVWDGVGCGALGHRRALQNLTEEFSLKDRKVDTIPPVQKWSRLYRVERIEPNRNKVECYTGGIVCKGQAGAGICISVNGIPVEVSFTPYGKLPTSHQAALMACTEACERLEKYIGMGEISIFTYLKATADSLDCAEIKSGTVLVLTAALQLDLLAESTPVCVTNHLPKRHPLMVRTMSLAKRGALSPAETEEFPVSGEYFKRDVAAEVSNRWNIRWHSCPTARQAKEIWPDVDENRSSLLVKSSRNEIGTVLGMYTGHNHYNRHKFLLGETDSPLCRLCHLDEETSFHILGECPALCDTRYRFLGREQLCSEELRRIALEALNRFSLWADNVLNEGRIL